MGNASHNAAVMGCGCLRRGDGYILEDAKASESGGPSQIPIGPVAVLHLERAGGSSGQQWPAR